MKTSLFLAIVLVSGFSAGTIHGLVNLVVVEPYLDRAISIENQNRFASGEIQDTPQFWDEFGKYRTWQKEGSIISGGILGLATGALFGLVFAYSRNRLPSQHTIMKALVLAGIMWLTIFFIPFLKYPANPPTVGDPHTIAFRSLSYIAFIALSGLGALGFAILSKKIQNKKFVIPIGYAIYMSVVFLLMPQNPDKIITPLDLINGFRMASVCTMTLYWITNAVILGLLWQKFQPHLETESVFK
jgi:hypothetical protein